MDIKTELRKLGPGSLFSLVQILEYDESWKRLMAIIPKSLTLDNFESRIAINNLPKYNTEHFKLIENAGSMQRKPCSEILFEEWGTSGRIRPRLGHLLKLLERAELYRAADYVAVDLLKIAAPQRPETGPAARINVSLEDNAINILRNSNEQMQRLLEQINYPSSLISNATNVANINQPTQPPKRIIPKIIVCEVDNNTASNHVTAGRTVSSRSTNGSVNSEASLIQREIQLERKIERMRYSPQIPENVTESTDISSSGSDMIQFSAENQIPAISSLLNQSETDSERSNRELTSICSGNIPDIDNIFVASKSPNSYTRTDEIPAFSQILDNANNSHSTESSDFDNNVPAFSEILNANETNSEYNRPALTEIMNTETNIPAFSNILVSETNMPAFSQILTSQHDCNSDLPVFDKLISQTNTVHKTKHVSFSDTASDEIPAITDLLNETEQNNTDSNLIPNISLLQTVEKTDSLEITVTRKISLSPNSDSSRMTCASPLPNLSLNTVLPHFAYAELEVCTRGFDDTMLDSAHSIYEDEPNGRKLGSGAFGSVYLGLGLLEKPIAVKKLNLNGVIVVNIDDTITKQFRNEVELLCKYKHENLLSLLGYSCDGPTYCLIYEYICGGALKDRLQSSENRLIWTNRLYIALGTARAVSYLHNAYSVPLIHRDIKSANILLDNANKPKLCDFGLIKLTPNQNTNTGTTIFGTSAYMAPEAFRGDVSVKLDTFSFGVVLLELLTGLPPLDESREGNDLVTHIEEVCDEDIRPLLDSRAGLWVQGTTHFGEQLYDLATQCLEEKKRRPVMADVVVQLSQLIDETNP